MRRAARGFTLIEILVAVAVFAVMAGLAYGALAQTLSSADFLGERMNRLYAIQRTMRHFDTDFMQLSPRPVRSDDALQHAPALQTNLLSGIALEFTRAGWRNPTALPRGTLQRVAYLVEDGELRRYHWLVLDRTLSNLPVENVLLDGVESLQLRYLLPGGDWVDQWPANTSAPNPPLHPRPRAIELVLTLTDEGVLTRLVEVAP